MNATLIHVGSGGDPGQAPLVLPRFDKPPTCQQQVPGYGDDGMYDPEVLGASCLIGKKGTACVVKTNNANATWSLKPAGGRSRLETDVPGLFQNHCSFKPRKGQSEVQLKFTLKRFELIDFLHKTSASDLYLVSTMQRTWSRPPKAGTEEQGEAAACYSPPALARRTEDREVEGAATSCYTPPATIKADVYTTPTDAAPTSSEYAMSRLLRETLPGPGSDSLWVDSDSSYSSWVQVSSAEISSAGDESDGVESAELAPPSPLSPPFARPIPPGSSPLIPFEVSDSSEVSNDGGEEGQDVGDSSDEMLPLAPDHAVDAPPCPLLHISSAVATFVPSNMHPP